MFEWIKSLFKSDKPKEPLHYDKDQLTKDLKACKSEEEMITTVAAALSPTLKLKDEFNEFKYVGTIHLKDKKEVFHRYYNTKLKLTFQFRDEYIKENPLFEKSVGKEDKSSELTLING